MQKRLIIPWMGGPCFKRSHGSRIWSGSVELNATLTKALSIRQDKIISSFFQNNSLSYAYEEYYRNSLLYSRLLFTRLKREGHTNSVHYKPDLAVQVGAESWTQHRKCPGTRICRRHPCLRGCPACGFCPRSPSTCPARTRRELRSPRSSVWRSGLA